jgi:hypothetical protein
MRLSSSGGRAPPLVSVYCLGDRFGIAFRLPEIVALRSLLVVSSWRVHADHVPCPVPFQFASRPCSVRNSATSLTSTRLPLFVGTAVSARTTCLESESTLLSLYQARQHVRALSLSCRLASGRVMRLQRTHTFSLPGFEKQQLKIF